MKIRQRLFISHLSVTVLSLIVLVIVALLATPLVFEQQTQQIEQVVLPDNTFETNIAEEVVGLNININQNISSLLAIAGAVGIITAIIVSWWLSHSIVHPLRQLADASRAIAEGNYKKRLHVTSQDELGNLIQQFNQMAYALDTTERRRQQLLADVSHEFKTPLTTIIGYMEALRDNVLEQSNENFEFVRDEALRLQRLVLDVETISKSEADTQQIQPTSISPQRLVEKALQGMKPQYESKNVNLTSHIPPHLPSVYADVDRTTQVIVNLLGNALQHTAPNDTVTITATQQGSNLCFAIHDTGEGIEASELKKIFQRFYRVDKSRTRTTGGSGIGLSIAQQIVHAHNGRIWAESEGTGKGSTFYFTLPTA